MENPIHPPVTADNRDLFVLAEDALSAVIMQVGDNQWDMPMPKGFRTVSPDQLTLRQVLNYHLYDDIWIPETLAGKTLAEVGDKYSGDLLGEDPKTRFREVTEASKQAVAGSDQDKVVHLTYGEYPTHEYLLHISCFRTFRAVELARIIGAGDRLPDELIELMHERLVPRLEEFRAVGIFQAPKPIPTNGDRQAELLALAGYEV